MIFGIMQPILPTILLSLQATSFISQPFLISALSSCTSSTLRRVLLSKRHQLFSTTSIATMSSTSTSLDVVGTGGDVDSNNNMNERNNNNKNNNLIMVVGSANQDLTSTTNILPTLGETVMGIDFSTSCGGKGANQAVAAGRLRLVPVTMVCRVGNDIFGQNLLTNFRSAGVSFDENETIVQTTSTTTTTSTMPSGVATIVVDGTTGDNMIIVTPGANYGLTSEDVRTAITRSNPSYVLVQLEILPDVAFEALRVAKTVGAITVLNTAPAPDGSWTLEDPGREFYHYVDVLILNETELRKLCNIPGDSSVDNDEETLAKSLLAKGVGKAVIVTLGPRGAMIVEKTSKDGIDDDTIIVVNHVNAPKDLPGTDLPVRDTVGAGDAFCGALASYWSTGMALTEAAQYACGVASITVRSEGAQTSYPMYDELPDCLKVSRTDNDVAATLKRQKMSSKPSITFVTGNKKKLEEIKQILSKGQDIPFEVTNQKIDLPELQGDTIEIAKEKCRLAAQSVNGPVFTEDTSLCFNTLNGLPGPYIKWFLEQCGHDGLNRMLDGFDDRSAYAQTIVAYTEGPHKEIHVFDGRTNGRIVPARGPLDFGWDPVFEPDEGDGMTYAEMPKDFKNSISHRSRSFEKFREFLISTPTSDVETSTDLQTMEVR